MTKQITVKLNEAQFAPLLDELKKFTGPGVSDSHSDLVGKCIFFLHNCTHDSELDGGKTAFDVILKEKKMNQPEYLLDFLNKYHEFKKAVSRRRS